MMIDTADGNPSSPLPSIAAYNIRFLSLPQGQSERWEQKPDNVRRLAKQYTMTALLETHADGPKADLLFCRHVDGVSRFYERGIAVLIQNSWADFYKPEFHVVIAEVMVAIVWE